MLFKAHMTNSSYLLSDWMCHLAKQRSNNHHFQITWESVVSQMPKSCMWFDQTGKLFKWFQLSSMQYYNSSIFYSFITLQLNLYSFEFYVCSNKMYEVCLTNFQNIILTLLSLSFSIHNNLAQEYWKQL